MPSSLLPFALLLSAPSAVADPLDLVLSDPEGAATPAAPPDKSWSLKLRTDEPLSARDAKGLVALARPCSNWAHGLRASKPEAAQRLFEQCVSNAMGRGFRHVALLPGDAVTPAVSTAGPPLDGAQLEAVMRVELECVGALVRKFGPRDQDEMRAALNSFHVAKHKVRIARRCLQERLGALGLKQGYGDYRYRPSYARPKNH